ncbi:MAG: MSMEG_1061 family FMN-dependent PPOX-type flavoprotein, partial [Pseudomonadales bacterium]|nr:MSMEG_1061 family FMN-dependent PPOX-type flavoprotein [Pseudomonadales bacterium]
MEALEALYDDAVPAALRKVHGRLTPLYRTWIERSRFCVLSTVGPEGTDASPRGDAEPVVRIADDATLLLPDWRGNNRLDSLRNIVRDGRVSLLFMIPGTDTVVRVNGSARLTAHDAVREQFAREGKTPRTVVVVDVREVYFQCAKALMRSKLWSAEQDLEGLPSAGAFLREATDDFDAEAY